LSFSSSSLTQHCTADQPEETHADRLQIEYIENAIHSIPHLYFSHTRDIVHSIQAQNTTKNLSVRDSLFVWNWKFLVPLLDADVPREWIQPMIQGLVAVKEAVKVLDLDFDLILITRRATTHQGTRFNCRGLDSNGQAANFCETEQIALFRGATLEGTSASFVIVRGSLPSAWTQQCSLIPVHQRARPDRDWSTKGFALFLQHLRTQMSRYGDRQVFVNLIDRKGTSNSSRDQAGLGKVFENHVETLASTKQQTSPPPPKLVWFDFHHETKSGWENLGRLLDEVKPEVRGMGFFLWSPILPSLSTVQTGCFRVNCMDNLDRTNVVQSIIARQSLLLLLSKISHRDLSSSSSSVFDSGFESLETAFKNLWADNADAVSLVYAGSPALKTDFTRTGKRSFLGKMADGMNSATRLMVNNFFDAWRQDEIDVLLRDNDAVHAVLKRLSERRSSASPYELLLDHILMAKIRWGALVAMAIGYLSPFLSEQHRIPYLVALAAFAVFVIAKQASERPRFFRK